MSRWIPLLLVLVLMPASPAFADGPEVARWRVGAPSVRETFRSDDSWDVDTGRNAERAVSGGVLSIRVDDIEQLLWSTHSGEYGDFYLEVDTAHVDGPVDGIFGVAFRMQDDENFYAFMISTDGTYVLGTLQDNDWLPLVDWTRAKAIETGSGGENRLGLLVVGEEIVLLVNNEELARVEDDTFSSGQIALVAGTNKDAGLEVAFDNLWLWSQESAAGGAAASGGAITRKSAVPSPTATPRPAAKADAVVNSDSLNVRGGPSTAYPVVATLKRGDAVRITGRSADSKWVKIDLAGKSQAWVAVQLLTISIDLGKVAVAAAPAPPPTPKPAANVAYLLIENHIGRYITVQVNDKNFQVDGKVGDTPGRYRFVLQGVGRYRVAAQLPNGGGHNFDLFVEPNAGLCAGRTGCIAIGQTFTQTYY